MDSTLSLHMPVVNNQKGLAWASAPFMGAMNSAQPPLAEDPLSQHMLLLDMEDSAYDGDTSPIGQGQQQHVLAGMPQLQHAYSHSSSSPDLSQRSEDLSSCRFKKGPVTPSGYTPAEVRMAEQPRSPLRRAGARAQR